MTHIHSAIKTNRESCAQYYSSILLMCFIRYIVIGLVLYMNLSERTSSRGFRTVWWTNMGYKEHHVTFFKCIDQKEFLHQRDDNIHGPFLHPGNKADMFKACFYIRTTTTYHRYFTTIHLWQHGNCGYTTPQQKQ